MSVPAPTRPTGRAGGPRVTLIVAGIAVVALLIGLAVLLAPGTARGSGDAAGKPAPAPAPAVTEDSARDAPGAVTVEEVPAPEGSSASLGGLAGDVIETPCFSFEAPMLLQNVSTAQQTAGCITDAKATVRATLDGETSESVWGEVFASTLVFDGGLPADASEAFDTAWTGYFSENTAEAELPREATRLDGAPAEVVRRVTDGAALEAAVVAAFPAHSYAVDGLESQLVMITIIAPHGSLDDYVQQVFDTWRWN